jgi:peptidoglycan hydrolase CwlO-like protein
MKRIFLIAIILLTIGIGVYAQERANNPTPDALRREAQDFLNQARNTETELESTLEEIKARNRTSTEAFTFDRLKNDILRLEARIHAEEQSIKETHDRGYRVSATRIDQIENLINLHKQRLRELEVLISRLQ